MEATSSSAVAAAATSTSSVKQQKQRQPPLFITIGPPCAGKTTLLQRIQEQTRTQLVDVTLDDQRDVYVAVPIEDFFVRNYTITDTTEEENEEDHQPFDEELSSFRRCSHSRRDVIIHNRSLANRIDNDADNGELRAILQRFRRQLSPEDFASTIYALYNNNNNTTSTHTTTNMTNNGNNATTTRYYSKLVASLVIKTVEDICSENNNDKTISLLPPMIQVYCVESLFRRHVETNVTGIEAACAELWTNATIQQRSSNDTTTAACLAWGNTNTRPREYREALKVAAATRRPVYFIVHATNNNNKYDTNTITSSGICLPHVSISQLMNRNVKRMLDKGKYIPGKTLVESQRLVHRLLETAVRNLNLKQKRKEQHHGSSNENNNDDDNGGTSTSFTKLQLDQELARIANYEMNDDRTVVLMRRQHAPMKSRRRRRRVKQQQSSPQ